MSAGGRQGRRKRDACLQRCRLGRGLASGSSQGGAGTCCYRLCLLKALTFCKFHLLSETQSPYPANFGYLFGLFHSIKSMFLPFFSF